MAVTSTAILSDLALVFDVAGESVVRRYSEVKPTAQDADVFLVGQSLVGMQDLVLSMIQRRTTSELENTV